MSEAPRAKPPVVRRRGEDALQGRASAGAPASQEQPLEGKSISALPEAGHATLTINADLLSNFVHQIVNPLNGVVGTVEGLIAGTIPQERVSQRLKAVRAQLVHAIELARNLAYLSQLGDASRRSEAAKTARQLSIPEIIIEAILFFQEIGLQKGIKIHLEDRETQYMVLGREELLRQVFMNIFENCVKYGDRDTPVKVFVHPQKKTGQLLVEVMGSGPGFLPEEKERIFELGYRGRAARAKKASGSGLGLYICREILGTFEATIEADYATSSRLTTFRIRFPHFRLDNEATERFRRRDHRK